MTSASIGVGLVDGGLDLEQARRAGGPADRPLGAEQVAVAGHRAQAGVGLDHGARLGEVVDEQDALEQPGHRRGAAASGARTRSTR